MREGASSESTPIAPVPRISLHAFCESPEAARVITAAAADRRMERAQVSVRMGGALAAIETYRDTPTPNVIVLESEAGSGELISNLEVLSELCDPDTKVVAAGQANDIILYRELLARGVSEYLVAPFTVLDFIRTISALYTAPGAPQIGKIIAVAGAKGGVGASTIAHNIGFSIARDAGTHTVIADMDLGFGTAGLDFDKDPAQGIAEAVFAPERIDENLVDRLLTKCGDKLSILAAPAVLDRTYDFPGAAFDPLVDILRATTPFAILDIPHSWTAWTRRLLVNADEAAIVAQPDLASLRNAKSMLEVLRAARIHDSPPMLILNCVGVPRRPEISVRDFAKTVDLAPAAIIPFEPKLFGLAANNGQMIAELEARGKIAHTLKDLAQKIAGRQETHKAKPSFLAPLVARLLPTP